MSSIAPLTAASAYNNVAQFINAGLGFATVLQGQPSLVQLLADDGSTIMQFDAVLTEQYDHQVQPTAFPVESGSAITDHAIQAPFTLSMAGLVSDDPIDPKAFFSNATTSPGITAPLGPVGTALAYATWQAHEGSDKPSHAAYATLCGLMTGDPRHLPPTPPRLVTVQTLLGAFQTMLLTGLSAPREAATGQALLFNMTFTQITVVGTQTLRVASIPALAAARARLGDKQGDALSDTFTPGRLAGRASVGR